MCTNQDKVNFMLIARQFCAEAIVYRGREMWYNVSCKKNFDFFPIFFRFGCYISRIHL